MQTWCARLAGNCPRARLARWGHADWVWLETARERDWLAAGCGDGGVVQTGRARLAGNQDWRGGRSCHAKTARERDWRDGRS